MSYTALYRKWRPDTFADVKGQDHIVTTLKNQIESDRIGHAYLFCGTRGTGKTTIAKILAKAVNCEHPVDGNPCGECAVCKAIANGSSLNVIEIDAASNNGVDNIRQIRDEVQYRPTEGKYKVYIIDEVHMLSIGAFNALLKTLEEPPAYVIFILATTEAHKIPVTIMSRCQRYDFKRISVETIADRLRDLVGRENAKVEDKALKYIAKMADGAMRDALSLLDQCMSFYTDRELRYEDVLEVLGTVDTEVFSRLLRDVVNEKVTSLIEALEEMILQGRDMTQLVLDFTWYLRNLLLLKASPEAEAMMDMSADNLERLKEETYMVTDDKIMRYIRILSELSANIKFSTQKRVLIEVALIKMTRPEMETDTESIKERLKKLEELVKDKEAILTMTPMRQVVQYQAEATETATPVAVVKKPIKAVSEDLKKIASNWRGIVAHTENTYNSYLKKFNISATEDRLLLVTDDYFASLFVQKEEHMAYIKKVISEIAGVDADIEVQYLQPGVSFNDAHDDLEELVKMNIQIED